MLASGNYIVEADVDNWDVPVGLEEEFATSAVAIATDIITVTHDIATGIEVSFSTTGTLPAGLELDTTYYAIRASATTIKAATSPMNAASGSKVDITDVGTGTHTIRINWSQTFATTDVTIASDQITVSNAIDTACKLRFGSSESTPDLPAPLEVEVEYYAINVDSTHIKVATTPANAIASTNITITDVGSGTHSLYVGEGQTEYDRQQIINRVEDLINKITGDYFVSTAFVIYRNGNDNDFLDLGLKPDILTVTEIKISGVELTSSWWTYNTEAVYLDPEAVTSEEGDMAELHLRLKYKRRLFPRGNGNIKITGTYGWSSIPSRVHQAAIILCKANNDPALYPDFDSRLKSEKLGDYSYTLSEGTTKYSTGIDEVDDLLREYIRKKPMLGAV
ncbi:hypothetical protein LCGC14_1220060 [marine sediment metagenome]|uniref:Uncharacterized protein n=1 Tax=marine sediment metagenome TaxID=412755 RepID=A0A0F9NTW1_9ZZZZ